MTTNSSDTRAIRVGIDVGGTFTDAVAIDAEDLRLVGQSKVLTTHHHPDGVAHGIIEAMHGLLEQAGRSPDDVVFLAHGTTQATNALLEGDVATVGIVGLGTGFEGWRTKSMRRLGKLELAEGKKLPVVYEHATDHRSASAAVRTVHQAGAEVVVGVQAFSVDDPTGEQAVVDAAAAEQLPVTATHVISKLYGLSKRTRTAAVNGSILPRMLTTANLVRRSIDDAGVTAPLMVMRCDGGVMSLDEMRERPLLTILSGPAAGAAGALLSERLTEGIFLETGGTSTDISAIRDGQVAISYAKVGGYDTYLKALDVRTVGIGGGSLVRLKDASVVGVGPRSAHIAELRYACYADPALLEDAELHLIAPMDGDSTDHVVVDGRGGRFAITLTCAANALGLVPEDDHAYAEPTAARRALSPLAERMRVMVDDAARSILDRASKPVQETVERIAADNGLDTEDLLLVGGGGGAAAVTPYLGTKIGGEARLAQNNAVISPIGVALAMVRDNVERVIPNPSRNDLLGVRAEAETAVLRQGAAPESVEVDVTVDPQRNVVIATASGATEIRARSHQPGNPDDARARDAAARSLRMQGPTLRQVANTEHYEVFVGVRHRRWPLKHLTGPRHPAAVVDRDGVVRFQAPNPVIRQTRVASARADLGQLLDELTSYGDGGALIPSVRMLVGSRLVDLSGLTTGEQVLGLAENELSGRPEDQLGVLIAEVRS